MSEVRECVTLFLRLKGLSHDSVDDTDYIHEAVRTTCISFFPSFFLSFFLSFLLSFFPSFFLSFFLCCCCCSIGVICDILFFFLLFPFLCSLQTRIIQRQMYAFTGSTNCRMIIDDKGITNLWAFGMVHTRCATNKTSHGTLVGWLFNHFFIPFLLVRRKHNYALYAVQASLNTIKVIHPIQSIQPNHNTTQSTNQ